MRSKTKKHLDNILATFSGEDGCMSFMFLRGLLEALDERAAGGDKDAEEVLKVTVGGLSRLIDLAKKQATEQRARKDALEAL